VFQTYGVDTMTRGVKVSPEERLETRRFNDLRYRARAHGWGDDVAGYQASYRPRPPRAVIVPVARDREAETAAARAREIEVATTRVIAQLSDLTVNWWHKVGSCSSPDIAGIVAATLNGRYQRDGRTVIRCQSRECDLYLLRQATVTQ
jgi:hypothetical protein